jgi:death-on-curing protein
VFQYIDVAEVLLIHQDQIARYGGDPSLRDGRLLISAVETVRLTLDGTPLIQDVFEAAAAYLVQITCNHPFADGNKRTGALAAVVFLEHNGFDLDPSDEEFIDVVLRVATCEFRKAEVGEFLRRNSRPIGGS